MYFQNFDTFVQAVNDEPRFRIHVELVNDEVLTSSPIPFDKMPEVVENLVNAEGLPIYMWVGYKGQTSPLQLIIIPANQVRTARLMIGGNT